MTVAEKIFARHMLDAANDCRDRRPRPSSASKAPLDVDRPSVKPGDTGFARADLRFSHEYVTPMAAIFFERYVGKDAKVNDPSSILFFRDHLTFPRRSHLGRKEEARPARPGHATQAEAAGFRRQTGNQAARRIERPQGLRRNLPLHRAGELRAAGTTEHRLRFAHSARGRDRMRGLRHRHHRRFQFLDHERRAGQSAGIGKDHHSRQEASQCDCQRFHSEDSQPRLRAQRQGPGQGDGVCGRSHRGTERGRARHHDQHGRGNRRLHRHRRA